jgi:serine/threonine protein kinase
MQAQYSTYRTLLAQVSGQGISEAEAQDILRQILSCLNELHDRQQAHGAISLDTVAYDYKRMEIILLAADGENHPIYLAPEIAQTQQVTPAADIYALGMSLIELLTGLPPESLKAENNTWTWQEHCNVSDQLQQILNTALLAEPAFRFVNAEQMLRSLQPDIISHAPSTLTALNQSTHSLIAIPAPNSAVQKALALGSPSAETHSLELLTLEPNHNKTTKTKDKKLKINFPNSQIYRKARFAQKTPLSANPKRGIPVLVAILLGFGTTISGAVGSYFYMQPKLANNAKGDVELANVVNQSMEQAIDHVYETKKVDANKAQLAALDKDKDANIGGLSGSKTILKTIPFGSRMRAKAEQFLTQSTEDKKGSDLVQKLGAATQTEKVQSALDTFKSISPSSDWQSRGKIEEAKQKLPEPTVALSTPSATSSSLTTDTPSSSTTEAYVPPAETSPPPVEAYAPSVETSYRPTAERSSGLPIPPAPRVAN